jgi:hypothetical protein
MQGVNVRLPSNGVIYTAYLTSGRGLKICDITYMGCVRLNRSGQSAVLYRTRLPHPHNGTFDYFVIPRD